jgi:hypothetical protein
VKQLQNLYRTFFTGSQVVEIRAIGYRGKHETWAGYARGTVAGYFNNCIDFGLAAHKLDQVETDASRNVYFTMNPVNPDLLGRANNRLKALETTTQDREVICRRWLLVDCDPIRPKDTSATDAQLARALKTRDAADTWLCQNGWPVPVLAMSGNGGHAVYRLPDFPNTDENTGLVKRCLQALAARFDGDGVTVDTAVFNAARITKLYGTHARKGDPSQERPHRKSEWFAPSELVAVTLDQLRWLADQAPADEKTRSREPDRRLDVRSYLEHYGRYGSEKQDGARTFYYLKDGCAFDPAHDGRDAAIVADDTGLVTYFCFHATCQGKTFAEARARISGDDDLSRFYGKRARVIELVTIGDLRRLEITFPPPLIDGLLERGDSLVLSGKSGLGKSLATLPVACAVAGGRKLFGQFEIKEPAPVLLIQSENSLKAMRQRIDALVETVKGTPDYEPTLEALDRIATTKVGDDCRYSGDLMDESFLDELREMITAIKAGLLILDPLISFHTKDENDNSGMREVLDRLTMISGETGVATFISHHHGKGNYDGAFQARGASAIVDWARSVLTMNRQPHPDRLFIKVDHTKAGNFAPAKSLLLEVTGPLIVAVEPDVLCPPHRVAEILDEMGGTAESKNKLVEQITAKCTVSRRTALDAIDRAADYGFVVMDKKDRKTVIRLKLTGGNQG